MNDLNYNIDNQLFRDLFEQLSIGLTICNPEGYFIEANEAFCKLIGYSTKELLKLKFHDITHPDDLDINILNINKLLRQEIPNYTTEKRYIRKDKSIVWAKLNTSLVIKNENSPVYIIATVEDISNRKQIEENLFESKNDWQQIFKAINQPAILLDIHHQIVAINNSAIKSSGKTREELIGVPCYKIFHGNQYDCSPSGCPMQVLLKSGKSETVEMEMEAFNGTYLVSCTPIFDSKGTLKNIIHIATDISYLKETEKALHETEYRYHSLLDYAPVGIAVHSEGKLVFTNQKGMKMLGAQSKDELIGKRIVEIIHPITLPGSAERINRMMAGEKNLYPTEDKYLALDGSVLDVMVYASPITYNGQPSVQVIVADITELKKVEQKLLDSEEKYRLLFDNMTNGFVLYEVLTNKTGTPIDLKLTSSNPEYECLFGFSDASGSLFSSLMPESEQYLIEKFGSVAISEAPIKFEAYIRDIDKYFLIYAFSPKLNFCAALYNDITRSKKTEIALINSEEKFTKLFHTSPEAIILARLSDERITEVNKSASILTGYSREELIGQPLINQKFWQDESLIIVYLGLLKQDNRVTDFELKIKMQSGEVKICLISGEIVQLNDGIYSFTIFNDITESLKTREKLMLTQFGIDHTQIGIFQLDEDGKIYYANEFACNSLGYTNDEITKFKLTDIDASINIDEWKNFRERSRSNGSGILETLHKRKDGTIFPVEISVNYFQFKGEFVSFSFVKDITERKKAEEILKASEEHFRILFEQASDGIFISDEKGIFIDVNSAGSQLFGYSNEEIIGLSIFNIIPPSDNGQVRMMLETIIKKGIIRGERTFLKHDGKIFWGEVVAKRLSDGRMQAFLRDISDRKKASEELNRAYSILQTLHDNLDEAIFSFDVVQNKMLLASIAHKDVFGYEPEDFFKNPQLWYELILPEDKPIVDNGFPVLQSGGSHKHEVRINHQNGQIRWIEAKMKPTLDENGKLIIIDGIVSDITRRKEYEEQILNKINEYQTLSKEYIFLNDKLVENLVKVQDINVKLEIAKSKAEESDKLKSIFLSNMSHEVRTPLNSIIGFTELLDSNDIGEEKRSYYSKIIYNSSIRLGKILNDIIDISKIETNQLQLSFNEHNVFGLLKLSFESFAKSDLLNKKPEIGLVLNYPEELKNLSVSTDNIRVQQVIDNLIANAIKYSNKGTIEIGIDIIEKSKNNFLQIYVKDNGIGIPEDKQHLIFERFRQIEESRYHEGTGLGLSISKGIVKLLGGEIWFKSEINKGTTFFFTIPFSHEQINVK